MKSLLQTLKKFYHSTFPLHCNATVVALEEALADATFSVGSLRAQLNTLSWVNDTYRRENIWLTRVNESLHQNLRVAEEKLEDIYTSATLPLRHPPPPLLLPARPVPD